MNKYKKIDTVSLLRHYADLMEELKDRNVIRTFNNPVADYAEWLVAQKLGLKLETNSKTGYDAKDSNNVRFQIKCRRLLPSNKSRQLGVV